MLIPKPDGSFRVCINYKNITIKDAFPITRIQDIFIRLRDSLIFSKVDFNILPDNDA